MNDILVTQWLYKFDELRLLTECVNLSKSQSSPLLYQHTPSLPQKQYAGCIPRQQNFFHSPLINPIKKSTAAAIQGPWLWISHPFYGDAVWLWQKHSTAFPPLVKIGCGVFIISGVSLIQIGCNSFVSFRFSANNILILSLYFASIRSFP